MTISGNAGQGQSTLECVINVSEGRHGALIDEIAKAAGSSLIDVHTDPWHNRSVLTLAGPAVESAAVHVAEASVRLLDLRDHAGAHPRLGVVDVVPFVPIGCGPEGSQTTGNTQDASTRLAAALLARDSFAAHVASELGVPCFVYGPERTLPDIRRRAFVTLVPDIGPAAPHPTAGAICVGARDVLVAYNLWLATGDIAVAREIARSMRRPEVRALGLDLGGDAQVSCNLVEPAQFGPADAFDFVASRAPVARAELVGLVPRSVLMAIPAPRWSELDLSEERTIEARLDTDGTKAPVAD